MSAFSCFWTVCLRVRFLAPTYRRGEMRSDYFKNTAPIIFMTQSNLLEKLQLNPGHLLHTMILEHEIILNFLNELEQLNQAIWKKESLDNETEENKKLKHIAKHLVEAEPHHEREEKVLFPEIEKRGVLGPPEMMRMEHQELRQYKKELKELAETIQSLDSDAFRKRLEEIAHFIIPILRDHIFKENNILYPMALEAIPEDTVWQEMKLKCDKIGYCCFTPKGD